MRRVGYGEGTRADDTNPMATGLAKPHSGRTMRPVRPGTRVEVRSRFEAAWARGFEVVERVNEAAQSRYKVRRRSDGSILPVLFDEEDLREEHRRGTWWVQ
jgi:hypothetical protein